MVGRWISIMLALAVLVVGSPTAWADRWYEHYAHAEEALAKEDYQAAIDELTQALEKRGDSGARVRTYGMHVTTYFPYLKLGIAYYQAGQYEAALRAFDTEERLGAIEDSAEMSAELTRHRQLAIKAMEQRRADHTKAANAIVLRNLSEARELRSNGDLDNALAAIDRVLSISPEHPEAISLAAALREELAALHEDRAREERGRQLIDDGIRLRTEGRLTDAAACFRQAAELMPESEAADLLAQVQSRIAHNKKNEQADSLASQLRRSEESLTSGDFEEALGIVEEVIATTPENREASELERRILARLEDQRQAEAIRRLLAEAQTRLQAGNPESAIATANLVLSRDHGHAEALAIIRQAYGLLSRELLGTGSLQNLPPAIRFVDLRKEGPDGSLVHSLRQPEFRLNGVVVDDSEVTLRVSSDGGSPVTSEISSQKVGGVQITEFRLEAKPPVGTTVLSVVATDPQGQSSRSEYVIRYRRPLVRSPWLWSLVLAASLVTLAVLVTGRIVKRQRLLRRCFNPFVAGPPVFDPALFFGRDRLLDRVLSTVPNNSLLLLGERRIGKTSLLLQLRLRLTSFEHPNYQFLPVSIDLQGVPEEAFFATVAEAVGEAVGDEPMAIARADDGYDSRELVRDLRRLLPTLPCSDGKRTKLVLLLDEIDELNGYSHRTNQRLRSLFMRGFAEQLVAVAAGVGIARQWEHEGSPWYNFFEELEVGPIDADSARELVAHPLDGVIDIDDEAVDRLLDEAAGRPYVLQKLALAVVQHMHEHGRRRITLEDVTAIRK